MIDGHSVDYSGAVPIQRYTFNDSFVGTDGIRGTADDRGNNNGVLDIGDLGTQVQRTNASRQRHRVDQFSADLTWEFDEGSRFDVGVRYIDASMTSARTQTQQTLGDWGINNVGDVAAQAGSLVEEFCLACKFNRYEVGDAQTVFRANAVDLFQIFEPYYAARGNPNNITGNEFDRVGEKIWSTYAQFNWDGSISGRPAQVVAGVRWENTKTTSFSRVDQPLRIEWDSDNDFTRVVSGNIAEITRGGEYSELLPSIDFRIEPVDDLVARVSYSRTLARPDFGNLFASQSANGPDRPTLLGGIAAGTQGNPDLDPLLSDNFDISLEWYFAPASFVSGAFFFKSVSNFVGTGQVEQNLFGLRDPTTGAPGTRSGAALAEINALGAVLSDVSLFTFTALIDANNGDVAAARSQFQANLGTNGQLNQAFVDTVLAQRDVIANSTDPLFIFDVATPINNREGNIHGFELQGQYFFGDSGFGVSGSLTKVFGDVNVDVLSDPDADVFALLGLSDSFNITAIYDAEPFTARIAYNWRGKFLSEVNRGGSRNPVFFDDFATLDASFNWDFNEKLTFSLEAVNILSEPIRSFGRDENQLFFAQELDPRILVGARYRF